MRDTFTLLQTVIAMVEWRYVYITSNRYRYSWVRDMSTLLQTVIAMVGCAIRLQ